jgi:hypothetical protein
MIWLVVHLTGRNYLTRALQERHSAFSGLARKRLLASFQRWRRYKGPCRVVDVLK